MPLMHGKSQKAFSHNVGAEMREGKPQKQSLAIAYSMKRKAQKKSHGGEMEKEEMAHEPTPPMTKRERAIARFEGGSVHKEELAEYDPTEEPGRKHNQRAMMEDDHDLNQHGDEEEGPDGPFVDAEDHHGMYDHAVENQSEGIEEDMVGRIMKQRQKMYAEGGDVDGTHMCSGAGCTHMSHGGMAKHKYAEGGRVANEDLPITDDMPAEYDDLHLDDHLNDDGKADYTGANSGDEIGDDQEAHDREDIVSRIMNSRKKKDKNPQGYGMRDGRY